MKQATPDLSRGLRYLVAENFKPHEIYRRICDVYQKACFSQKMFTNWLDMDLPLQD